MNFLLPRIPEILGILITISTGLVLPWLSRKSSNYKKIDRKLILASLLHLVYLSVVPFTIMTIGVLLLTFIVMAGITINIWALIIFYGILAIITLLAFFGVMRWSKRMRFFLGKAKEVSKKLYVMLNGIVIISIVLSYITLIFVGSEYEAIVYRTSLIISGVLQLWWIFIVIAVIWKASKYVYSQIKITMLDGVTIHYDCSPSVCRVHRNYIRILKRDENGIVVQELQIYEAAIKHIEYLK